MIYMISSCENVAFFNDMMQQNKKASNKIDCEKERKCQLDAIVLNSMIIYLFVIEFEFASLFNTIESWVFIFSLAFSYLIFSKMMRQTTS